MRIRLLSLAITLVLTTLSASGQAPKPGPFDILEDDRVLLLGDTLLEREGSFGEIETRLQTQFPERHFTVRNLAFSADTPLARSRASFDPAAEGFKRLKEQLELIKPTVAILGYGMAASLQEITDKSGEPVLNADPDRYGAEPMSAARFKAELAQLMDAVGQSNGGSVRFILLAPLAHEDLRDTRPSLPDPSQHNLLLAQYAKVIQELAQERAARFVESAALRSAAGKSHITDNGIHPSAEGMRMLATGLAGALGWNTAALPAAKVDSLLGAIQQKNELFFHRWRPANSTYLFGFRKREQGRNAQEIPQFDPLIAAVETKIDQLKLALKNNQPVAPAPAAPPAPPIQGSAPPKPDFKIAEGYQIELWAENPLLEKPTQMNWDAQGRLWVCSSSLYPQIAPGAAAEDKILILEDTKRSGRADKSTVFTSGLLIPTGVEPDFVQKAGAPAQNAACYVGQSTELLRFEDRDGDGKAESKRIVLSGFGTEDTHHIVHTLHWGFDGRLYFNQSIYIHSHIETPWGVVRLNSGGVFAYDPHSERLEVFNKGHINTWGHQTDAWGQSFQTDGAGTTGVTWGVPGATFTAYEGGRKTFPSISPGSYPKMAGLELIYSNHFPADWQSNAITCDFRAHRIVRFVLTDLAQGDQPKAGFTAKEQADFVRTNDVSFRPIDLKIGPDGALYVADWSNPVINHGEVDFRDPRRDHHMGRIWRISKIGAPALQWQPLTGLGKPELYAKLLSPNLWEKEQTRRVLAAGPDNINATQQWASQTPQDAAQFEAMSLLKALQATTILEPTLRLASSQAAVARAAAARSLGELVRGYRALPADKRAAAVGALQKLATDANPRVQLEAVRALPQEPTAQSAALVLDVASKTSVDPFLEGALWMSINELATPWLAAVADGSWSTEGRDRQLAYGLSAIDPRRSAQTIDTLFAKREIPGTATSPWIEIIGKSGGPDVLRKLFNQTASFDQAATVRALNALNDAARVRKTRAAAAKDAPDTAALLKFIASPEPQLSRAATLLAGNWQVAAATPAIVKLAASDDAKTREAAFESLTVIGSKDALEALSQLCDAPQRPEVRRAALVALARVQLDAAVQKAPDVLATIQDETVALETWRAMLQVKGSEAAFAAKLPKNLPKPVAAAGARAAREIGKRGAALLAAFPPAADTPATGAAASSAELAQKIIAGPGRDLAKGELIYRRASSGCVICHAIGGAGGKVGPELTSLGASAPLDYIIESTLNPAAKVKEGYNAVALTTTDGALISGIQIRETAQEVFLRDVTGTERPVVKANIASTQNIGSIMPAGLIDALPEAERLDLFAFLGQLGKPGIYDASKGNVARVWSLYPGAEPAQGADAKAENSVNAYTLVDGQLLKEKLTEALQMLAKPGESILASTKFQADGKTQLTITGADKIWLDGKPISASGSVELSAGVHTLSVRIELKQLPAVLRALSPDARFLGN